MALQPRTRVRLHSLKRTEYNGRVGIVESASSTDGRCAVLFGDSDVLSLKPANLHALPTPAMGLVIIGDSWSEQDGALAFLRYLVASREARLLERGVYLPVLALVGSGGALHPESAQRPRTCAAFMQPTAGAPHGGLSDAALAPVLEGSLDRCPGYRASKAHRRLRPALSMAAYPSMVVVDVSAEGVGAKFLAGEDTTFRLERFGGRCVALALSAAPQAVLEESFRAFTGWILPLVRPPANTRFLRCMWCGATSAAAAARVCGGCECVCYCSSECQLSELRDGRQFCHAAYCTAFRRARQTPTAVSLPEAPQWVETAMSHGGMFDDECALLRQMGHHRPPYDLFCRCVPDMQLLVQPTDWVIALVAELARALPPPRTDDGGDTIAPERPLCSWADYYAHRQVSPSSPVALLLSFALTVYHAIVLSGALAPADDCAARERHETRDGGGVGVGADNRHDGTQGVGDGTQGVGDGTQGVGAAPPIVVHYLGAASREAALLSTFAELAVLLPGHRLRLMMIGPATPSDVPPSTRFEGGAGGWVEVTWHRGVSHDSDLPAAHVAVAPNSGINEYEEWQPCIASLDEQRTPFYFTDYSEIGLLAASVAIREHHGISLTMNPTLNPFRQPLDRGFLIPPGHTLGAPWIGNGFMAAIGTSDSSGAAP